MTELQRIADEYDARAVMDLPRASSNELVKLGVKLGVHARRLEALRELGNLASHEALLTIVSDIDTILLGIYGDDADWQEYKAKYELGGTDGD